MSSRGKDSSLTLILLSLVHLSLTGSDLSDVYGILTNDDHAIAEQQDRPAVHSASEDLPAWESYNRWLCFPASSLSYLDCRDKDADQSWNSLDPYDREGTGYYALMEVIHVENHYRFKSPGWISSEKCLREIEEAKALLEGQAGFCILAAELPTEKKLLDKTDAEFSVWVAYGIKTSAGRSIAPIYEPGNSEENGDDISDNEQDHSSNDD